jgi:hypothetical protein
MRIIISLIITALLIWGIYALAQPQTVTTSCDPSYTSCTTTAGYGY